MGKCCNLWADRAFRNRKLGIGSYSPSRTLRSKIGQIISVAMTPSGLSCGCAFGNGHRGTWDRLKIRSDDSTSVNNSIRLRIGVKPNPVPPFPVTFFNLDGLRPKQKPVGPSFVFFDILGSKVCSVFDEVASQLVAIHEWHCYECWMIAQKAGCPDQYFWVVPCIHYTSACHAPLGWPGRRGLVKYIFAIFFPLFAAPAPVTLRLFVLFRLLLQVGTGAGSAQFGIMRKSA